MGQAFPQYQVLAIPLANPYPEVHKHCVRTLRVYWRGSQLICLTLHSPSSRVATAQRKLKIVNDANVKAFTARSVECKLCDATIELEGGSDYDLTKWEEHKLTVHKYVRLCRR